MSLGVQRVSESLEKAQINRPHVCLLVLGVLPVYWTFVGHEQWRAEPPTQGSRAERAERLASRGKPHYRLLEPGLHIGYRRLKAAREDRRRRDMGCSPLPRRRSYVVEKIGTADDFSDADGTIILSFAQAQDKARTRMVRRAHTANGVACPLTVQAAVETYLESLETNRKSAVDTRHRARRTSTRRSAT